MLKGRSDCVWHLKTSNLVVLKYKYFSDFFNLGILLGHTLAVTDIYKLQTVQNLVQRPKPSTRARSWPA